MQERDTDLKKIALTFLKIGAVSPEARLRWILNYFSAHPREILLSAALAFRDDLIARGM